MPSIVRFPLACTFHHHLNLTNTASELSQIITCQCGSPDFELFRSNRVIPNTLAQHTYRGVKTIDKRLPIQKILGFITGLEVSQMLSVGMNGQNRVILPLLLLLLLHHKSILVLLCFQLNLLGGHLLILRTRRLALGTLRRLRLRTRLSLLTGLLRLRQWLRWGIRSCLALRRALRLRRLSGWRLRGLRGLRCAASWSAML